MQNSGTARIDQAGDFVSKGPEPILEVSPTDGNSVAEPAKLAQRELGSLDVGTPFQHRDGNRGGI